LGNRPGKHYSYSDNNPISNTDPNGLDVKPVGEVMEYLLKSMFGEENLSRNGGAYRLSNREAAIKSAQTGLNSRWKDPWHTDLANLLLAALESSTTFDLTTSGGRPYLKSGSYAIVTNTKETFPEASAGGHVEYKGNIPIVIGDGPPKMITSTGEVTNKVALADLSVPTAEQTFMIFLQLGLKWGGPLGALAKRGGPLRLVVGGGRAAGFPAAAAGDVSLNIVRGASPTVVGDIANAPFKAAFGEVYFERVPFTALTGPNIKAIAETARILQPGGKLIIETGIGVRPFIGEVFQALGKAGFKVLEYAEEGGVKIVAELAK
jgi:hypothetical protein